MIASKKILPLIISILLFISNIEIARPQSIEKQAVLAVLTLNIARFTSWPEVALNETKPRLNLCVFGDNIIQHSFEAINNKKAKNKTIHIINLSRLRNLQQCQLLYINNLDHNRLIPLLQELKNYPILTIGENIDFLQSGGMIGLENINGKIKLIINLPNLKQANLIISSRLLKLARIVDYPSPIP